jgi:hypothetical protein
MNNKLKNKNIMKKLITLLLFYFTITQSYSSSLTVEKTANYGGIEDGWYNATVKYTNYSTGANSTYSLKVKVEYGKVSKIDFGNGGSVHSGYNNEDYIYSGGYLSFEKDNNGNTITASTTVTVSDTNGMRYFKIIIE